MRLTERDKALLDYICRFQCLTKLQIAKLLRFSNVKICERRLRKLLKAGCLQYRNMPSINYGRSPYLFYLGEKGAELFNTAVSKPRINLKLSHQQKNTDLMIEIINAFKDSPVKCEILPEHLIRTSGEKEIIPDGAFMLKKENKHALFLLENCSGTEIIKSPTFNEDIESKIIRYCEMFENNDVGFFKEYFNCDFNRFRLLFVTNRLVSISQVVREHDNHGFIWLKSLGDFNKDLRSGWYISALNKANQAIA